MSKDTDEKNINEILADLAANGVDLKNREKELKKSIEILLALRPDAKPDDSFREKLRSDLAALPEKNEAGCGTKRVGVFSLLFGRKFSYALSFAMVLVILIIPAFYYLNEGEDDNFFQPSPLIVPPSEAPETGIGGGSAGGEERAVEKLLQDKGALPMVANPASVYCQGQGGVSDNRILSGGQQGFCLFNDGSECDEWKFFRGECKKGDNFCKNFCGDGACSAIVCEAVGCPCAETGENCPSDCKE